MEKDTYRIQLQGITEIPQPLNTEEEYQVIVERMNVSSTSIKPNEDGTETYTYKLKIASHANLVSKGVVIPTKDVKSLSKRFRGRLWVLANEEGIDEQEHYDEVMNKLIRYAPEVVEFLKDKH